MSNDSNYANQFVTYVVASTAQLPNVSGATIQTGALQKYDRANVLGTTYICDDATLGAAVWSISTLADAYGLDVIQTITSSSSTTIGGNVTRVVQSFAGAAALVLPTVASGAAVGRKIVIMKSTTNAGAIVVTPDATSEINDGGVGVAQTMVGLNATASTTASSASTNDIAAIYVRISATKWRSTAA